MKQHGNQWYTPAGESTLAKYLPAHEKLYEKIGQRIATEAIAIEKKQREIKALFIDLCKEALRNSPDKGAQRRFTFYTFDHEYKIEFDIKEEYVRVYRATKKNPLSKDYELIVLDFNKTEQINQGIAMRQALGLDGPKDDEDEKDTGLMEVSADGPRMIPEEEQNNTGTLDFENKNN